MSRIRPSTLHLLPLPGGESHARHSSGTSPFSAYSSAQGHVAAHATLCYSPPVTRNGLIREQRERRVGKTPTGEAAEAAAHPCWAGTPEGFIGSARRWCWICAWSSHSELPRPEEPQPSRGATRAVPTASPERSPAGKEAAASISPDSLSQCCSRFPSQRPTTRGSGHPSVPEGSFGTNGSVSLASSALATQFQGEG